MVSALLWNTPYQVIAYLGTRPAFCADLLTMLYLMVQLLLLAIDCDGLALSPASTFVIVAISGTLMGKL